MTDSRKQIADLLIETGKAHHQAFIEADGADPEWPLWYSSYLDDKLPALLNAELTRSEITYALVLLHKRYTDESPDAPWAEYYADFLIDEYGR